MTTVRGDQRASPFEAVELFPGKTSVRGCLLRHVSRANGRLGAESDSSVAAA